MDDILSDVIRALQLRGSSYYRAELYGDFALSVPRRPQHVRFHLALDGEMRVAAPSGGGEAIVRRGDVFLVTMGAPHTLMHRQDGVLVGMEEAKRTIGFRPGDPFRWGKGPHRATLVCGEFSGATELFHPVFGALPTLVHAPIEDEAEFTSLAEMLALVDRETKHRAPGWMAIANRLSEIVMIQVLRAWVGQHPDALGVLHALRDPRIKQALDLMHQRPEVVWTVLDLASAANMSRTSFSTLFCELMGSPPMKYLASWRMEVARSLLHNEGPTLAEIAEQVGYSSQASFTKVFRERVGLTPGAYRDASLRMS